MGRNVITTPVGPGEEGGAKLVIGLRDPARENPEIVRALAGQGAPIQFVNELRHSLEDVYLSLLENHAAGDGGRP